MKRLFVPLTTEAYDDFSRGKCVEVRRCEGKYAKEHIFAGREVEFRKGYSGASFWATIVSSKVGTLEDVIGEYALSEVEPRLQSTQDAVAENISLLGGAKQYIAFKITPINAHKKQ